MKFVAFAENSKYLLPIKSSVFLTPSPSEIIIESPSPISGKCMSICNNNIFTSSADTYVSIDTVDNMNKTNIVSSLKHPGQAVKIITDDMGEHKIVKENSDEVRKSKALTTSKSCTNFEAIDNQCTVKNSKSNSNLKDYKSCDENLIKFIFTKHGIQVISDVETIV